jgi:hypothetical protein
MWSDECNGWISWYSDSDDFYTDDPREYLDMLKNEYLDMLKNQE